MKDLYKRVSLTGLTHIKGERIDITYWVEHYKYSDTQKKDIYVCHLIPNKPLKVSNYLETFEAQIRAIQDILKLKKETNKKNSVIHTFFYLTLGIKFIPDVRLYENIIQLKKDVDKKYKLFMGEIIVITGEQAYQGLKRYEKDSPMIAQIANIRLARSVQEAYEVLN